MPDRSWTFCRRCGWHSSGTFAECPKCGNKSVNVVDNGLLLDPKGDFYPTKEERE
jgi:ribosomal protein L37E